MDLAVFAELEVHTQSGKKATVPGGVSDLGHATYSGSMLEKGDVPALFALLLIARTGSLIPELENET
eukprot:3521990-Prorocentrum_lima.AAC.1